MFSTDRTEYGGTGLLNTRTLFSRQMEVDLRSDGITVKLPAHAALVFACKRRGAGAAPKKAADVDAVDPVRTAPAPGKPAKKTESKAEAAKEQVVKAAAAAKKRAGEVASAGKKRAGEVASAGKKRAGEVASAGKKRAGEVASAGKKRAGEVASAGKKRAGEVVSAGKKAVRTAQNAAQTAAQTAADKVSSLRGKDN